MPHSIIVYNSAFQNEINSHGRRYLFSIHATDSYSVRYKSVFFIKNSTDGFINYFTLLCHLQRLFTSKAMRWIHMELVKEQLWHTSSIHLAV